jgi:hypothetical protein
MRIHLRVWRRVRILTLSAAVATCAVGVAHALEDCGNHVGSPAYKACTTRNMAVIDGWIEESKKCNAGFPRLRIGMSDADVVRAVCIPDHINSTVTLSGKREQWVYANGGYLYFEDGQLVAIQSRSW